MVGRGKMGEPQKTIGQQYGNPVFATLFSLTFLFTPLYIPTIHIPTIHCLHCFCACFACCLASLQFLSKENPFQRGICRAFLLSFYICWSRKWRQWKWRSLLCWWWSWWPSQPCKRLQLPMHQHQAQHLMPLSLFPRSWHLLLLLLSGCSFEPTY